MNTFMRFKTTASALLAVTVLGAAALPSMASAAPNVVSGGVYRIAPGHNNPATKVLEVQNASTANGAPIVQNRSPLSGSSAHQRFTITQAGTDNASGRPYFRIRPTHATNKCFDVAGASLNDGASVVQFDCISGHRNQQFYLDSIFPGSTIHTITPRHSGLRLDVAGASTAVGAPLIQFAPTGGRNQEFLLQRVG